MCCPRTAIPNSSDAFGAILASASLMRRPYRSSAGTARPSISTTFGSRAFASSIAAMTSSKRFPWLLMRHPAGQIFEAQNPPPCPPAGEGRVGARTLTEFHHAARIRSSCRMVFLHLDLICARRLPLPHHARNAARLVVRRHHVIFQEAPHFRTEIAGSHIGPGAALGFGVAGRLAGFARRIGRYLEIAIIAASAINGKLPHAVARLDEAGAADAGCGGAILHPRRHLALEPARRRPIGGRVVEAPGPATAVAVASGGARRGIAGPDRKVRVVAATAVEPHLRAGCRRQAQDNRNRQPQRNRNSNHSTPVSCPEGPPTAPPQVG